MTPEQFTYWLNGYVELTGNQMPTKEAWKSICEHLGTVFNKVTPKVEVAPEQKIDWSKIIRDNNPGIAPAPTIPLPPAVPLPFYPPATMPGYDPNWPGSNLKLTC